MAKYKNKYAKPGYINKNRQRVISVSEEHAQIHNTWPWLMVCEDCGHKYATNGGDVFQKLCPKCQGGEEGLAKIK
jgi:Zn finger protein HypA/HybF involved in hydrogenase expression